MTYIPAQDSPDVVAKVIYEGKTSRVDEAFTALDWLARLVTHIPNKGEQMVRYYGYYSNKSKGIRKKDEIANKNEDMLPRSSNTTTELAVSDFSRKKFRKNWARLIQKIYFVDPLSCPKCGGVMRIISFIEDDATIKTMLMYLDLWLPQNHNPPQVETDRTPLHVQSHRSYEWWEAVNHISSNEYSDDTYAYAQSPYEDEYSQLEPCEY